MQQQRSSLDWLDESSLALIMNSPKSQMEQKYENLFKQCSQYRSQIRQLKQDNQWLSSLNQGLSNECNILKDLLNEKKQMIVEANTQLRIANQQISRLQDLLAEKTDQYKSFESQFIKIQSQIRQKCETIQKLERQMERKNIHIENLGKQMESMQKQKMTFQSAFQSKERAYISEMQERVIQVLNRCEKPQKISPSKSLNSKKNAEGILGQLVTKIQNLAEKLSEEKLKYISLLSQKEKQVAVYHEKINTLQFQLKQAGQLVQQYQQQTQKSTRLLHQQSHKLQTHTKQSSKFHQSMTTLILSTIKHFWSIFQPFIKSDQHLLDKLLSAVTQSIKSNRNLYEIQIITQQLKSIVEKEILFNFDLQKLKKQNLDKENKFYLLQEEYDSLKLKLITLQRQYEAVVDDNCRILKFNQLSKFRTERNVRTDRKNQDPTHFYSSKFHSSLSNKENIHQNSNPRELQHQRK